MPNSTSFPSFSPGKKLASHKRLVYELQIAQDVEVFQDEEELCSRFYIIATAREGHTLGELESVIEKELDRLKKEPPGRRELQRSVNTIEASFLDRLEGIGDLADQINAYFTVTGNPDYFGEDLGRYKQIDARAITAMAVRYLDPKARVVLSVVPQGKRNLAAEPRKEGN